MKYFSFNSALLLAVSVFAMICATQASGEGIEAFELADTDARPIERVEPRYPRSAQRKSLEGWVDVSFVVQPDGTVTDPIVEDSSRIRVFEESALIAISKWKYKPATRNGKPILQCKTKMRFSFQFEGKPGVRSSFIGFYKKTQKLIASGDLDAAASSIEEQRKKGKWNLYEYEQLWLLKAHVAQQRGDEQAQLFALYRTGANSDQYFDQKLANMILPVILSLELKLSKYSAALETFDVMKKSPKLLEKHELLVATVTQLVDTVRSGEENLSISGEISEQVGLMTGWNYRPLRRQFAFYDVSGELNDFELRCDWKRFSDDASKEVSWKIPESWGKCNLYVYGKIGTTFKLVEYPNDPNEIASQTNSFSNRNDAYAFNANPR